MQGKCEDVNQLLLYYLGEKMAICLENIDTASTTTLGSECSKPVQKNVLNHNTVLSLHEN